MTKAIMRYVLGMVVTFVLRAIAAAADAGPSFVSTRCDPEDSATSVRHRPFDHHR